MAYFSAISNKSTITNFAAVFVCALSYFLPVPWRGVIQNMGLFALSGAVTNWIAVHMLFERVPGLYGSGVVQLRFAEFKAAIRGLIMEQFFTRENIDRFFSSVSGGSASFDLRSLASELDDDQIFIKLKEAITESPFGPMVEMMGGDAALEPMKQPLVDKIKEFVLQLGEDPKLKDRIAGQLKSALNGDDLIARIDQTVQGRLDELTPAMVKNIVQDMIRKHLGWLVVWGGVFGAVIGLITSLILS